MRWLIVAILFSVAACTPGNEPPSTRYAPEKTGYDVARDTTVIGQYIASGSYVEAQGVNPEEVKWRALLKGMEAARKDGYDLAVWMQAGTGTATQRLTYVGSTGTSTSRGRGFIYVVRGYRSTDDHPSVARPIAELIEQINRALATFKA